jgi:hypothetical protein
MKRHSFFFLFLLTLILPGLGHSQDKVTALDSLAIDIWPDYDRPSVLVLLTGTLLAGTDLPASVIIPFPETAQLNAVARIDSSDGGMKDDIIYTTAPGEITFIIPDLRFRVEYYLPYTVNDNRHTFDFTWLADLSVDFFQLRIQQPKSADSLTTVPGTIDVAGGGDGFTYHTFPVKSVPAGQSFSVNVDYPMTTAQLSVARSAPQSTQESALPSTSTGNVGFKWFIMVIVGIVIIIVIFYVWKSGARRAEINRPVTHRAEAKGTSASRFCTNCGHPTGKNDKFCRKCGAALRGE